MSTISREKNRIIKCGRRKENELSPAPQRPLLNTIKYYKNK